MFHILGISFEVVEGGFLDIAFYIQSPDGKILEQKDKETNGRYTFTTQIDGNYMYCFSNEMSTVTPKIIMFNSEVTPSKPDQAPGHPAADGHDKDAADGKGKSYCSLSMYFIEIKF